MRRLRRPPIAARGPLLVPFYALVLAVLLTAAPRPGLADEALRTISVRGEGEVSAPPDIAVITIGVTSQAETAQDAMRTTSRQSAALIDELKGFGVAERDIRTGGLSLRAIMPPVEQRSGNGPPQPVGFRAIAELTVRLRDVDHAGALIDRMMAAGANQVSGISFDIAEPGKLLDQARRKAMADARRRAELYAEVAGVELGPVLSVREEEASPPRPMMRSMAMAESSGSIAPGEQQLHAGVSVTYAIR